MGSLLHRHYLFIRDVIFARVLAQQQPRYSLEVAKRKRFW